MTNSPVTYQAWKNRYYGLTNHPEIKSTFWEIEVKRFWYKLLYNALVESIKFAIEEMYSKLATVKRNMLFTIYPQIHHSNICTLMFLTNLAYPEWINMNCDERKLLDIVCMIPNNKEAFTINIADIECQTTDILIKSFCYNFQFYEGIKNSTTHKDYIFKKHLGIENVKQLEVLFIAINVEFEAILQMDCDNQEIIHHIKYKRYFSLIKYLTYNLTKNAAKGFFVLRKPGTRINVHVRPVSSNMFNCKFGSIISAIFICDGNVDCGENDNSDEALCNCTTLTHNGFPCKSICNQECKCSPLYYLGKDGKCHSFNKLSHMLFIESSKNKVNDSNESDTNNFLCKLGNTIDITLVDDLVPDCGIHTDDEEMLQEILKNRKEHKCLQPDKIPCRKGHTKCFSITEICVYRLNFENQLSSCRTGEHMEDCENFECNMKFKCPQSYCIPWAYVCNGKWDCPQGYDESKEHSCGQTRQCKNMFHCSQSQLCIHIEDVCDKHIDCPLKDDEYLCDLKGLICPQSCTCHKFALSCFHAVLKKNIIFGILPYTSVFISKTIISDNSVVRLFTNAIIIQLPRNNIHTICNGLFLNYRQLLILNVGFNEIEFLDKFCFPGLVQYIDVNNNLLNVVHSKAFYNLIDLKFINLSNNFLEQFPKFLFYSFRSIKILSVKNISLKYIDSGIFNGMLIRYIETDDYRICCISPTFATCTNVRPWYLSCSDLLPNLSMRIVLGFVAGTILITNLVSILMQFRFGQKGVGSFNPVIVSVNLTDIICSISLLILLLNDLIYQGNFVVKEITWRGSISCSFIFGASLFFSILSPAILSFMSFSRLMIVLHPLDSQFMDKLFVKKIIIVLVLIILFLCAVLVVIYKVTNDMLPTSLCLPFIDPTGSFLFIKVITVFNALYQLGTVIIICVAYGKLVRFVTYLKWGNRRYFDKIINEITLGTYCSTGNSHRI